MGLRRLFQLYPGCLNPAKQLLSRHYSWETRRKPRFCRSDSPLPPLISDQCYLCSSVVSCFLIRDHPRQSAVRLAFPITRSPDYPITRSLFCVLLPAFSACIVYIAHPGVAVLLKTITQPQFDRPVTDRSKALFPVFQRSNLAQFFSFFLVSTVRSAEGRKGLDVWLIADY